MFERVRARRDARDRASLAAPEWVETALTAVAALAAGLAGWQAVVWVTGVPTVLLPSPASVAQAALTNAGTLTSALVYTGTQALLAWVVAVAAGAALAFVMAASTRARQLCYPGLIAVRVVPMIVFAPILVVLLGPILATRVLLGAILAFFPVAVATLDGLRSVPATQVALFRTVGASRWQRLARVNLPNALPSTFAGLKIATPLAVEGVVLGEFLAGSRGVGVGMLGAATRLDTPLLFAYVFALVGLGLVVFGALLLGERAVAWDDGDGSAAADTLWMDDALRDGGRGVTAVTTALSLAGVAAAWVVAAAVMPDARLFLAGPGAVLDVLAGSPALFVDATAATLEKLLAGWTVGASVGAVLGTVASLSPRLRTAVYTWLVGVRVLPVVAVAPILLVWLGVSFESGVVLVAAATFFPIAVATTTALGTFPTRHRDLLRLVDAPPGRALLVRLRYAVPSLLAGVKLSVVTGISGVVVAEWFVASDGLGVLVLQQTRTFQPDLTFGAIAALFAVGGSLFGLASLAQNRLLW